jgi:predicted phosphodiesterase
VKKYLLIPDTHAPYHDVKAWALAMKVGRAFKPDGIVVMGDFIDAYPISQFPKTRRDSFEAELASARTLLDDLEKLGAKEYHYLEGNHEYRLTAHLAKNCPELFGLFPKLPQLLGLKAWVWHEYHDLLKLGKAYFTHDTGGAGPTAHHRSAVDVGGNVAIGHTHHAGIQYKGTLKGTAHFGAALGCLADRTKADYMTRVKTAHWVQGVGLGYAYKDGDFHLNYVPFVRGRATVEGKEVKCP